MASLDLGSFEFVAGDEPPREDIASWRMDPEESLSDWTIEVTVDMSNSEQKPSPRKKKRRSSANNNRNLEVYHVHKCFLGVGPRSSQYFARLFKTKMSESNTQITKLKLHPSAAKAFPAMLDFVYDTVDKPVAATTDNAVALRHLASYFGVKALFTSVNDFIQDDMNKSNALIYLQEAAIYQDEKIIEASSNLAASGFENLDHKLLRGLSVELFSGLLSSPEFACSSEKLSVHIAAYLKTRPDLDSKVVEEITDPNRMPTVDSDSALFLLQQALDYSLVTNKKNKGKSLKKRCIDSLSKSWNSIKITGNKIPPETKNEVYVASLETAKASVESLQSEVASLKALLSASQSDFALVQTQLDVLRRTTRQQTTCNSTLNANLNRVTSKLNVAQNELAKFVRVPSEHRFETHHVYDRYERRMKPFTMPKVHSQHDEEGYIFRQVTMLGKRNYPVFYYEG